MSLRDFLIDLVIALMFAGGACGMIVGLYAAGSL